VVVVFYLMFRIFVRLENMERNITKIVRKDALKDKDSQNEWYKKQPILHNNFLKKDTVKNKGCFLVWFNFFNFLFNSIIDFLF